MTWTKKKPKLSKECILLTATYYSNTWNVIAFSINKVEDSESWYWALCDLDGYENDAYEDLSADLYMVIDYPKGRRG